MGAGTVPPALPKTLSVHLRSGLPCDGKENPVPSILQITFLVIANHADGPNINIHTHARISAAVGMQIFSLFPMTCLATRVTFVKIILCIMEYDENRNNKK